MVGGTVNHAVHRMIPDHHFPSPSAEVMNGQGSMAGAMVEQGILPFRD